MRAKAEIERLKGELQRFTASPAPIPKIHQETLPLLEAIADSTEKDTPENALESPENLNQDKSQIKEIESLKSRSISPNLPLETNQAAIAPGDDGLGNVKFSELTDIPVSTLEKLKARIKKGETFIPRKYPDFFDKWLLGSDGLWYAKK